MFEWMSDASPLIERLSLTLLHFLWQGYVVVGVAASLMLWLRSSTPHALKEMTGCHYFVAYCSSSETDRPSDPQAGGRSGCSQ
jgi:hypothetical protein